MAIGRYILEGRELGKAFEKSGLLRKDHFDWKL
jgi:hypothetical protein